MIMYKETKWKNNRNIINLYKTKSSFYLQFYHCNISINSLIKDILLEIKD